MTRLQLVQDNSSGTVKDLEKLPDVGCGGLRGLSVRRYGLPALKRGVASLRVDHETIANNIGFQSSE